MYIDVACREKIVPGTHHTNGKARSRGQSVLFTNDPRILQTHKEMVSSLQYLVWI